MSEADQDKKIARLEAIVTDLLPIVSRIVAYGAVDNTGALQRKYCRRNFNVEVRRLQAGVFLLDFDTVPSSPSPPLPRAPIVLVTAHGHWGAQYYLCYGQARNITGSEAVIHLIETPNNPQYTAPRLADCSFDFLILEG
jgi:hypothetical protein